MSKMKPDYKKLNYLDLHRPFEQVVKRLEELDLAKEIRNGSDTAPSFDTEKVTTSPSSRSHHDESAQSERLMRHAAGAGYLNFEKRFVKRLPEEDLFLKIKEGDLEGVKKILQAGSGDPLRCTEDGLNCWHLAARYGRHLILGLLIEQTPSENLPPILERKSTESPFRTALHYAADNVNTEVINLLVPHQTIDVLNDVDGDGNTGLMIACDRSSGGEQAVEILLQKGAAVSTQNDQGYNCLMIAASRGNVALVQRFMFSDVGIRYLREKRLIGMTEPQPHQMFVNASADVTNETALHRAAARNYWKVLQLLKNDHNIIVDARDWLDRTPLMIAAVEGNLSAVQILLMCHADVNLLDKSKRSSLHAAASQGRSKVLFELLMVDDLDVGGKDKDGDTALDIACQLGYIEAVRQIVDSIKLRIERESSTKVARRSSQMTGPRAKLRAACSHEDGRNCLHIAASHGRAEVIQTLVGYRGLLDIDSQDRQGNTALILAAESGHTAAFQMLVQSGANVFLLNDNGYNCVHVAAKSCQNDLLEAFLIDEDSAEFLGSELLEGKEALCPTIPRFGTDWMPKDGPLGHAWNVARLELLEKTGGEKKYTPLHLAGMATENSNSQKTQILLMWSYLILALKVRGFSNQYFYLTRDDEFQSLVREQLAAMYEEKELRDLASTHQSRYTVLWFSMKLRWFWRDRPSTFFRVNKISGGAVDNLLIKEFVEAFIQSLNYCNAGDEDNTTVLHYVANRTTQSREPDEKYKSFVERLLKYPAIDATVVDSSSETPLHLAMKSGNVCVVRQILEMVEKAHITPLILTAENSSKQTPCSIAFDRWQANAKAARRHGRSPDPNAEYSVSLELLETFVIEKYLEQEDAINSAQSGCKEAMSTLLHCLAVILRDRLRRDKKSPAGGDALFQTTGTDDYGLTLVHYVAYRGSSQLLVSLLKRHEYQNLVNKKCTSGYTPLHFAVVMVNYEVVRVLLKGPASTEHNDRAGKAELAWRVRTTEEDGSGETPLEKVGKLKAESELPAAKDRLSHIEQMLLNESDVREYVDKLYRDRQVYVDASNAMLVGAAVIASVTFAGWLQPPLGYAEYSQYPVSDSAPSDGVRFESYAAVQQHPSVQTFWVFNSLSFFFAVAAVVCGAGASLQMQLSQEASNSFAIKGEVKRIRKWLAVTSLLMAGAIVCVLGAFGTAGYVVLPPEMKFRAGMIVTLCIGIPICVASLYWFFRSSGIVKVGVGWALHTKQRLFLTLRLWIFALLIWYIS
ncbi:hypothetical protein MPTK1_5g12230 [Marchantia polymorpha subsp. ruderalis]